MNKNQTWKIVLIIVLVAVAGWTLYPPNETLMPGIDLAGGTSLIYEIDAQGLKEDEKEDLAQRMITVLRRRIDPANIQNLVWRPEGNTRFEIKMPLASAETRDKRREFDEAREKLLAKNINRAKIMRSLPKPPEERAVDFNDFAQDDPNRQSILEGLATAYDERKQLQDTRDSLYDKLTTTESTVSPNDIDFEQVKSVIGSWIRLNDEQLKETLKEFLTDPNNIDANNIDANNIDANNIDANNIDANNIDANSINTLTKYVQTYSQWNKTIDDLTDPNTGKNPRYREAIKSINKLNLTMDQMNFVLEMPSKSTKRREGIKNIKAEFPDRKDEIEELRRVFDEYRPFQGRLDDPKDLQRMLKGAGILEFRLLPTQGHEKVDMELMKNYIETLKKGPKYSSDKNYVWCEIEKIEEWQARDEQGRPCIVGQFGDKYYVLASNKPAETILHGSDKRDWKLEKAYPTQDRAGLRAIGFLLDEKGGKLFWNITDENVGFHRPLCILLDGVAISAPKVDSRIRRDGVITGNFTKTQVGDMVNKLNAGSLPSKLIEQPISVNTIGPSMGADNRDQGIEAGIIGLIVVLACMLVYYCLAGSIADVALLMNVLLVLSIMASVRATFTLPGIAGIILTIGMSVDANVLIFERIREEQEKGSSLRIAITNGYQRALRTILDANITTFITAAILYWVASEEVKGFAIVLMLGIGSSMFTALFVTRVIFDLLLSLRSYRRTNRKLLIWQLLFGLVNLLILVPLSSLARRLLKDRIFMLRLIHKPNVNWMRLRPVFLTISALLIAGGLYVFFTRDDTVNNKYDVEFTGGTNVQVVFKDDVTITRQEVEDRIRKVGSDLNNPALATTNVYSIGGTGRQYEINTTETNKITTTVTLARAGDKTIADLTKAIRSAPEGGELSNLIITSDANEPAQLTIATSQMNKTLVLNTLAAVFPDANISEPAVEEVVNNAIVTAFAGEEPGTTLLQIQQNLRPRITSEEQISETIIDSYPELVDYLGGIKITCEIQAEATAGQIKRRFKDLLYKPDMRDLNWYDYEILDSELNSMDDPNQSVKSFVYVSAEPEAGFGQLTEDEWTDDKRAEWARFAENEKAKVLGAASLETTLPRVRQFDPSVGREAKNAALAAIILSLFAIVTYIWVRFGDIRYGIAAIAALVHDVCITLGAVTACTYIASTAIGESLLIGDFKINLAMIAAFLTLIGYSLNDTIVVFDRIRENRHKARLTSQTITNSINQTISRTILTSFTTFIVVLIMYIFGGPNLRGFTFAIGLGILIGTYSSIAIAAPILLLGTKGTIKTKPKARKSK